MSVDLGPGQRYLAHTAEGRYYVATQLINQSGLLLNLDAGVTQSYSGSGSVWYDLATGNDINLSGTTGYTTDAYGGITFGSTGQGNSIGNVSFSTGWTISAWIKHTGTITTTTQRYITVSSEAAVLRHNGSTNSNLHAYLFNNAGTYTPIEVDEQIYINNYYNVVATFNNSSIYLYKNAQLIGVSTTVTLPIRTPTSVLLGSPGGEEFFGNMYTAQVYNRPLSQTEVTSNFNVVRGRFDI